MTTMTELLDQSTARALRCAQINAVRFRRISEELERHPHIPASVGELVLACRAAASIDLKIAQRRAFAMFDKYQSDLIQEAENMSQAHRRETLEARAVWHEKLATQALKDCGDRDPNCIDHARGHTVLAQQLRELAKHTPAGGQNTAPLAPEKPKPSKSQPFRPGSNMRSVL